MIKNLQEFTKLLKSKKELIEITQEVDPYLEIAEIHRRTIDQGGPALLFTNVKGSDFPIVTNLFGTTERVNLAFGAEPKLMVEKVVDMIKADFPPKIGQLWKDKNFFLKALKLGSKTKKYSHLTEFGPKAPTLSKLPILTSYESDGGAFVTLPLVYTEHPETGQHNLGMYRIQRYDDKTTGIHWQIHKGGGFHYAEAEKNNKSLPVNLYVGGPPSLILSAIAPLPENVPELILASLLLGGKIEKVKDPKGGYDLLAEAEFAFVGKVEPHIRRPEGPFGDHYGYDSLQHDYPVFNIDHMYHKKNAIYPATVVGIPKQEDFYIGDYLQDLLSPIFPIVMPGVEDLWSYGEAGFHSLSAAKVKSRYPKEAFGTALRILGEGQLSLTKVLFLSDGNTSLKDFKTTLVDMLKKVDWNTDLFIFSNVSQDTLDYTGPKVNEGSKMILMGIGKIKRELPYEYNTGVLNACTKIETFCPGCLVIEGESYTENEDLPKSIAQDENTKDWPMIFLVDKGSNIGQSSSKFLWTCFTRFEPANDIHPKTLKYKRYHPFMEQPIVIDCRIKPWHTKVMEVDPITKTLVDGKWELIKNLF